jgi:hypothetical protein
MLTMTAIANQSLPMEYAKILSIHRDHGFPIETMQVVFERPCNFQFRIFETTISENNGVNTLFVAVVIEKVRDYCYHNELDVLVETQVLRATADEYTEVEPIQPLPPEDHGGSSVGNFND